MNISPKRIYFLGIGGVGMGNAAILAKSAGHVVAGCDRALYPPMDGLLRAAGITPAEGFREEDVENFSPDSIVVGNVLARGRPEVEWLLNSRRYPFTSLPDFLFRTFLSGRHRIVVAGTHGKTTTSACAAYYLRQLGHSAGYFIGGAPVDFPSGAATGSAGAPFVIEGDEYDSAFFDRRSKFIHYAPDTLIINRIDFDHADIFRDLLDVRRTFTHLLRIVPGRGDVFLCGDDPNGLALLPCPWTNVHSVGCARTCDFRIGDYHMDPDGSHWTVAHRDGEFSVRSALWGEFNAGNVTMAILAVHRALRISLPGAVDLGGFHGVGRRQQKLVETDRHIVYEDFGHHPRAIEVVLRTLRARHPDRQLIACFEPATNTSMRRVLQDDFSRALSLCDRCLIGEPRNVQGIPVDERLSIGGMVEFLRGAGVDAREFSTNGELQAHLRATLAEGDEKMVAVIFSNGAFPGVLSAWRDRAANGGGS